MGFCRKKKKNSEKDGNTITVRKKSSTDDSTVLVSTVKNTEILRKYSMREMKGAEKLLLVNCESTKGSVIHTSGSKNGHS